MIELGDRAKIESGKNRLVVNQTPDAVYLAAKDTLIFKSLSAISSMFNGIDTLYKEATEQDVEQFLGSRLLLSLVNIKHVMFQNQTEKE